jgi:hypothetical protein
MLKKLSWFALLWFGGVASVTILSLAIRWAIMP